MKVYTILPNRIWTRGRSNRLPLATKRQLVKDLQLTDVVQLATRPDPHWDELPVRVHNVHMTDSQLVPAWVDDLAKRLSTPEHRVLVMCQRGRNRSVFVAGLILQNMTGTSGMTTIEHLHIARPNSLSNPTFVEYLLRRKYD